MATIASSLASSLLPLLCLLVAAAANHQPEQPTPASPPVTLPGCPDKCGNVSIPYPFGTKDGCFLPGFFVVCDHTFDPPRPFLSSSLSFGTADDHPLGPDGDHRIGSDHDHRKTQIIVEDLYYLTSKNSTAEETKDMSSVWPIELVSVFPSEGKAQVLGAFSYDSRLNDTHRSVRRQSIHFAFDGPRGIVPFLLSDADNVLMGIGSNAVAEQTSGPLCQSYFDPGTLSDAPLNGSCDGQGCCHTNVPRIRTSSEVATIKKDTMYGDGLGGGGVSCSYAMIVEKTWYNFSSVDLDSDEFLRRNAAGVVPIVVHFTTERSRCPEAGEPKPDDFSCKSDNSKCVERLLSSDFHWHHCSCSVGYQGNPYIHGGCQDIDECTRPHKYPCHGKCRNTPGDYECTCPAGTRGNAKEGQCTDLFPPPAKISVGVVGGLFMIAILVSIILVRHEKRKMAEFFKKNGGPTLEKAKNIKIYKKDELDPILKPSNLIGEGCFGEVYKGHIDNQSVAVKKPKKETDASDQFANEVIIQSRVIHKNIVKLIGCCLEVDKPILVYEFLSKGSLDDILHRSNSTPITLECRLNIAAESSEGLAYLHSKASRTEIILHGDVKPANILLDDSFTPKISDFGISRLIKTDKEHTDLVIGDMTYMDPVYRRNGLLTDKSDVYSFGVVLLELISRKKATYSFDNKNLVGNFLDAHESQKEVTELYDKDIAKPEVLNLLNSLTEIAVSCLNLDVHKRPKMTEVAEILLMLKRTWSNTLTSHVPID